MSLSQKLCSFASSLGERTSEKPQGERERTQSWAELLLQMDTRLPSSCPFNVGPSHTTHTGQSHCGGRGQGPAGNGIRAPESQNRCLQGLTDAFVQMTAWVVPSATASPSIQMNRLTASLPGPLGGFCCSTSLPSDWRLPPAFSPGLLSLLPLWLPAIRAGRSGGRVLGMGWGVLER